MAGRLLNTRALRSLSALLGCAALLTAVAAPAQTAPTRAEIDAYTGLLAAAARDDAARIGQLAAAGAELETRDARGRTAMHVAAHLGHRAAMRALAAAGADVDALDQQRYDIVTIAAVANDRATLETALDLGASAGNVTSPYDGTALIAAAHLGHAQVVETLIHAGAPLDHVNNLGWTALIEAIVLGDGGTRHTATVRALIDAGADVNLADGSGTRPYTLAHSRGYAAMAELLRAAGAHR